MDHLPVRLLGFPLALSAWLALSFAPLAQAASSQALLAAYAAPAAGGSVTVGNRATTASFSGTTGTIASFTVSSSSPLIVHIGSTDATDSCTGVTWNGTAMTRIGTGGLSSGVGRMYVYGIKAPAATTANIVASFSGTVAGMMHAVGTVGGTDWRTAYERDDGIGAGPGLTVVDSVSGDLVMHGVTLYGNTITWDAGETTTTSTTNNFGGNGVSGGLSTKPAVGASTVVGATDSVIYGEIGIAVRP